MPQSETAANPWHQEEEDKNTSKRVQNKQTNAHSPPLSSPSEVITMLKGLKKYDNREQGMTTVNFLNIRTTKKNIVITLSVELCGSTIV